MTTTTDIKARILLGRGGEVANTTKPFPLLDLPPELWSKIGKLVVDQSDKVTDSTIVLITQSSDPRERAKYREEIGQPAITRTCQVLRAELLPYYYRSKISVQVIAGSLEVVSVGKWLRSIGDKNRSALARVWLRCYWIHDEQLLRKYFKVRFDLGETVQHGVPGWTHTYRRVKFLSDAQEMSPGWARVRKLGGGSHPDMAI
ncbi:hypothetical protein CLAFUW4_13357 [Fulvia fulva]|uniref:Uncharacterized protein n=1 Tax=Passalora fulva TaxID=5499 RepID=A0A9Q8PKB4_PASFU|nr:uncharacterized protein CLAFUR5_13212 [Fulvia fulva]KAK4612111.1 hypothetical protein CLAFUR4_13361 [Fulvia fulva]KAK4612581.1 hypothetical protein CLAFUR0_13367 [Fulvia fulva]UJO23992.1 hypothetical protein CLAFUR5_13212 [Fulvia fulva]WPV20972.1 hypothetical protein CLAFUW4_13357 [Fulvia fulva]WPV36352.1 hypothetical protein CLAFUW7_13364 [Fulvia fulva]